MKRRSNKRSAVAAALLASVCLLTGCGPKQHSESFTAMNTFMVLTGDKQDASALADARQTIERLSALFDHRLKNSPVKALNQSGTADADGDLLALLSLAAQYAETTGGAFNPCLGKVIDLWHIGTEPNEIPSDEVISGALQTAAYTNLTVKDGAVSLQNGAQLDLGAIAKGYAADAAAEQLRQAGVERAVLSLGGNISLLGKRNGEDDWVVAIQSPRGSDSDALGKLTASDCAIVTSGDYQRYMEIDGVRYNHIMGKDGRPADAGLCSVTVVADSGAKADAYSTALFVMGVQNALQFYKQTGGFEAVLVTTDKQVYVTDGLQERFELLDEDYSYAP